MRKFTPQVGRIVGWNVYVGSTARNVHDGLAHIIVHERPDAIAVQEVSGDIPTLRRVAKTYGYRLIVGKRAKGLLAGQESQSTAILVRKGVSITSWGVFKMAHTWKGPKRGLNRPGRTFPTAVIGRPRIRLTGIHMPTGKNTKANRTAWNETIAQLRVRADRWRKRSVWLGDWNNPWRDHSPESVQAFADSIGAKVYHDEGRIDYAVARGFKNVRVRTGRYLNSDHRYFVVDLEW